MASFLDEVFGAKPNVPNLQPTDPLAELTTLLGGEIKSWPEIEQLSSLYQNYMLGALGDAIPGFSDILKQGGVDTQATLAAAEPLIKGQIPSDVVDQVMRDSAFASLGAGSLGGPMGTAFGARQLGLTSLDLMNQGANLAASGGNAAQRWDQIAQGTILPPSSQLYSPEWFSTFIAQQRAAQQAIAQQRANVAAAPNPALQALNQWVEQVGGTVVSSYLGGGAGGMGGMGGGKGGANYMTSYNPNQYLGGNVSTPSGAMYGTGAQGAPPGGGMPSDVTTPGYSLPSTPFNAAGAGAPIPYLPNQPYNIGANPFNTPPTNFSLYNDPTQAGYYGGG